AAPMPRLFGQPAQGNFETVRVHVDGVEREISSFLSYPGIDINSITLDGPIATEEDGFLHPIVVVWDTSPLPSIGEFVEVVITAAEHEPDRALPLHVGVRNAAHEWGTAEGLIDPFDLLERIYIKAGVRYDHSAIDALKGNP